MERLDKRVMLRLPESMWQELRAQAVVNERTMGEEARFRIKAGLSQTRAGAVNGAGDHIGQQVSAALVPSPFADEKAKQPLAAVVSTRQHRKAAS